MLPGNPPSPLNLYRGVKAGCTSKIAFEQSRNNACFSVLLLLMPWPKVCRSSFQRFADHRYYGNKTARCMIIAIVFYIQ